MQTTTTIIEAIIGNHLDDSNRSILVAIERNDITNFRRDDMKESKSMLEFVGIILQEHEFVDTVNIPNIYMGAVMQQDVKVILNAFTSITNNILNK